MAGWLALWGAVTVVDIVIVHWVLRRHRLYRGEHGTAVEAAVTEFGAVALVRGATSLRRGRALLGSSGWGAVIGRGFLARR